VIREQYDNVLLFS